MLNFNHPYLATSLGDFWSRWHISLSTWFRDYVYVPLGGNRRGTFLMYRNLFLTMVISGLWHGAAWTFIIWGAIHAIATMVTRRAERSEFYGRSVPIFVKRVLVFTVVCFAWIFFRAESLQDALLIVSRIATTGWSTPDFPIFALVLVGVIWCYQFLYESRLRGLLEIPSVQMALAVGMLLYLLIVPGGGGGEFIYFQF